MYVWSELEYQSTCHHGTGNSDVAQTKTKLTVYRHSKRGISISYTSHPTIHHRLMRLLSSCHSCFELVVFRHYCCCYEQTLTRHCFHPYHHHQQLE